MTQRRIQTAKDVLQVLKYIPPKQKKATPPTVQELSLLLCGQSSEQYQSELDYTEEQKLEEKKKIEASKMTKLARQKHIHAEAIKVPLRVLYSFLYAFFTAPTAKTQR